MRAMMIPTGRAEDLKGATSLLQIGRNRIQPRPDLPLRNQRLPTITPARA